jgi:choline dehydrogenase
MNQEFDFIVVGAGSAGCVLADQLSQTQQGGGTVLVLEAGGSDRKPWVQVPIGYGKTFYDHRVNWKFHTQPEAGLNNRTIYVPRGKVVGGSSSINAMVYARGLPHDFDDWAAAGNSDWDWEGVKATYESFECPVNEEGRAATKGSLFVSDVRRQLHPLEDVYFKSAAQAGLPFTDDFNGDQPEGVGRYRINTHKGLRWSGADAFLRPALRRGTVKLQTEAFVEQIVLEGKKATGVRYRLNDKTMTAHARRGVVLAAGAIQSPQLLQVSGIGPGGLLSRLGVPVVHDLRAVGANLQDHLAMSYYFKSTQPTLNNVLSPWWGKLMVGLQYGLRRSGPLSISVNQCGGFVKSDPNQPVPDMQLYCNPITYTLAESDKGTQIVPDPFAGFILCFQPCRPKSRGTVMAQSPDMHAAPLIAPQYLSHPDDADQAIRGAKLIRTLARTPAFQGAIASPMAPDVLGMSDAEMLADFKNRASTCYHPVGTCMMGTDPNDSVVDSSSLRVHGMQGLYVVDASVFPNVTSGNTHAPTTMVAHKGAQAILGFA